MLHSTQRHQLDHKSLPPKERTCRVKRLGLFR